MQKKNPIRWLKRESDENTYYINGKPVSPVLFYYYTSPEQLRVHAVGVLGKRKSFWKRLWERGQRMAGL